MNNKSLYVLIAILLVGAVAAATYLTLSQPGQSSPSPASGVVSSIGGPAVSSAYPFQNLPHDDLAKDDLVRTLSDNVIGLVIASPRNFDSFVTFLDGIRAKFAQTKLWQKFNVDQLLTAVMEKKLEGQETARLPASPKEVAALLHDQWAKIDQIAYAVSKNTFTPEPNVTIPQMLLVVNFHGEAARADVSKLVEGTLAGAPSITMNQLTLTKNSGTADSYSFTVDDKQGHRVDGTLEFQGTRALLMVGTKNPGDFFAREGGALLTTSPRWSGLSYGVLPAAGVTLYVNIQAVFGMLEQHLALMSTELGKAGITQKDVADLKVMQELEDMVLSFSASDGLRTRSCARISKSSPLSAAYKAQFSKATADRGKEDPFTQLVGARSVFALTVSGAAIELYLQSLQSLKATPQRTAPSAQSSSGQGSPSGQGAADTSDEWKRFNQNLAALSKLTRKNPIRMVGVVVNAPQPEALATLIQPAATGKPPLPDFNLYIEFKNGTTSDDFAALLNDVATLLLGDSGLITLPIAKLVPAPESGEVIEITLAPEKQVFAAAISSNAIAVGKDAAAVATAKAALQQPATVLTDSALGARQLTGLSSWSDSYALIQTSPLIDIALSFAPMGLMMAPPQYQITMPDIEEAANLLRLKLYGIQNTAEAADNVFCSDSRAVALYP